MGYQHEHFFHFSPTVGQHTPMHSGLAHLPRENHHEVHDIPAISKVGALVENEAQCDDLDPRLEAKDPDEIRLRVILRRSTGQCSPLSPQQNG